MPIHLPLERQETCFQCGKRENLSLCGRCGEASYCSKSCQVKHWEDSHSATCGKSERIDLSTFYPILACMAEISHVDTGIPAHPACNHQIINDVNPGTSPVRLPNGQAARLLVLGKEMPITTHSPNNKEWWPQANTLKVMSKLMRRITREGYALPIVMSICLALTDAIYTTNFDMENGGTRVRLRYHQAPIADFGICMGSADVKNQDKLAYWLPTGDILLGQDPDEHFWIYFTTVRGEEITVDVSMFTFNMCLVVHTSPYLSPTLASMLPFAPVFYRDRIFRKTSPELYKERRRISILRNDVVQQVFGDPDLHAHDAIAEAGLDMLVKVAEEFGGRKFTDSEERLMKRFTDSHCDFLKEVIMQQDWKQYPAEVPLGIEADPGETDDLDSKVAEWASTARKWKREHRKTKKNTEK